MPVGKCTDRPSAKVDQSELQSAQLRPIGGELAHHGRPLPFPHLERPVWKTQSAASPSATPVAPVRNQGGRAARLGKAALGLPKEPSPPFQILLDLLRDNGCGTARRSSRGQPFRSNHLMEPMQTGMVETQGSHFCQRLQDPSSNNRETECWESTIHRG
jgi:hypothetical protein